MNLSPRSWASSIVGFALAVLLAGWALHTAAELVLSVWLPLVMTAASLTVAVGLVRLFTHRDRW